MNKGDTFVFSLALILGTVLLLSLGWCLRLADKENGCMRLIEGNVKPIPAWCEVEGSDE